MSSMMTDDPCLRACLGTSVLEDLNRECFCLTVDPNVLRAELAAVLANHGLPESPSEAHANLFSASPVFVSRTHVEQAALVVAAVEEVVGSAEYQNAVLAWAPPIARFVPGSLGGLLGLDFHLGVNGPRLIEINTNPGGALLNALLGQAQRLCMPEITVAPTPTGHVEAAVLDSMLSEWRSQRGSAPLRMVAIVDAAPTEQYLYPEFVLYRELLRQHAIAAEICAPEALRTEADGLTLDGKRVDFVYNRLTDFALEQSQHAALRDAYLAGTVVLSPHPRGHALYADKRNLSLLGSADFLARLDLSDASRAVLIAAVPHTQLLTAENREALWSKRNQLFFKPAGGYGSKASYRGDKLTRRVWDEMANTVYVAQELVVPSERVIAEGKAPLKVDIRCYAYRGKVMLYAARLYQGQTTNFRTPGGGFAPVLTSRKA